MQFRLWLREGPSSEKTFTAIAAAVALSLLAWAFVPAATGGDKTALATRDLAARGAAPTSGARPAGDAAGTAQTSGDATTATAAPAASTGGAVPTSAGGTAARSAADATTSGPVPGASGTTTMSQCDNRATDTGVTDKQVLIGVVIYTLGEANPALGIPTASDTIKMYNAVFDHYNKLGGIQCRKLVPKFYEDFVLQSESGRSACLQMQQDKVFAVMNNLFRPENRNCVPQAKIANFWATSADTSVVRQFSPYVLSFQADYDRLMRDYALGANAKGFFNGMVKLGILEQTCFPDRVKALRANLAEVGIGPSKISAYNAGCPAAAPTPDQMTAAVIQFRRDGVTHVMSAYREAPAEFARAADGQAFKPKYAFVDDQFSSLASNASPPWQASLDGAMIIEKSQEGAEYTPGSSFSPATADCTAITKSVGLPGPTSTGSLAGSLHALACIHTKMLVAAATTVKPLKRTGLAAGLISAGKLDLSFPAGPALLKNPTFPIGAQFWRTSVYKADCTCVRLLDPVWRPEFAK
jgi:hypothetical protein